MSGDLVKLVICEVVFVSIVELDLPIFFDLIRYGLGNGGRKRRLRKRRMDTLCWMVAGSPIRTRPGESLLFGGALVSDHGLSSHQGTYSTIGTL